MKKIIFATLLFVALLAFAACGGSNNDGGTDDAQNGTNANNVQQEQMREGGTFAEARTDFVTNITREVTNNFAIPTPPIGVFDLVHFESTVGDLAAFVSSDPGDGGRHPIMIWVTGGWSNAISDIGWSYPEWDNDQTGSAFRDAGMLMMYPSFRGANGNPGQHETLFGEIDDIVAAFHFAASLPYVDPARIYLGGHSTGATRVLLAAAYFDGFAAAFAFGPVGDIMEHNVSQFTFDTNDAMERRLRSPIYWLDDIAMPTFVIEGSRGNGQELRNMQNATSNPNVNVHIIDGGDHFDVIAPISHLIAPRLMAGSLNFTQQEMQSAMNQIPVAVMPIMATRHNEIIGVSMLLPVIWQVNWLDQSLFLFESDDFYFNFWDMSMMYLEAFAIDEQLTADEIAWEFYLDVHHTMQTRTINGRTAYVWTGEIEFFQGELDFHKAVVFQSADQLTLFEFLLPVEFEAQGRLLFEKIVNSIVFE